MATIASFATLVSSEDLQLPTRNVNLTEHFHRFIESGVTSGRFSNASEVVREGLRLLEQREQEDKAKIEWLRAAAREGFDQLDRGDYVTLNSEEDLDTFLDQIHEEVSAELAA
ncbi:MAG: type II toxin-antitoxin system ParD family antitoxin [Candidatus Solibacter sp.]